MLKNLNSASMHKREKSMNKFYSEVAEYIKVNYPKQVEINATLCEDYLIDKFIFNMPWDMEATQEPVSFKNGINWMYKPTPDKEFIFQFNRHRFLINLGQQYRLTGDVRFVQKYVQIITHWITTQTLETDKNNEYTWRSLEIGLRATTWLYALEYFKGCELIDDKFMDMLNASLKIHQSELVRIHGGRFKLSNWGVIQDHGLLAIACYFGERDVAKGTLKLVIDRLCEQLDVQLSMDFVHWEVSPLYHTEVLNCFLDSIIFLRKYGMDMPISFMNRVEKMGIAMITWMKPDYHHPCMGDSDHTDLRDMMAKLAMIFKNGIFKNRGTDKLDYEGAWIYGIAGVTEYDSMEVIEPNFTNCFLDDSGQYILRENWSETSNYLHFINTHTGGGHAHNDKLHFDLCINGDDVLIDAGRYTYSSVMKERFLLKRPESHNTITMDNRNFMTNDLTGWSYIALAENIKNPNYDTSEVSIISGGHLGYLKRKTFTKRTIIWLKPDIFIVIDNFFTRGFHSFQRFFNFSPNATVDVFGNKIVCNTKRAKSSFHFISEGVKLVKSLSRHSVQYNKLEENLRVTEKSHGLGCQNRIVVIDSNSNAEVKKIPVKNISGTIVDSKTASGISIRTDRDDYTIILTHKENMKYIEAKGVGGSAKIMIFKNGKRIANYW